MQKNKIKKIISFVCLLFLFFSAISTARAQSVENVQIKEGEKKTVDIDGDSFGDVLVEVLSIGGDGRPVIKTTSLAASQESGSQYTSAPFIAQYIAAMYKYAVMIIVVLATIFIIIAGVMWIISGGSPDRINSAKQMITRSITGLVIALGSYTLLYTINPDLVSFRSLEVLKTSAVVIIPEDRTLPAGTPANPPENLVSIKGISNLSLGAGADGRANPSAAAALNAAITEFTKNPENAGLNNEVIVSTAYRSPISQYGLMTEQCGCKSIDELLKPKDEKGNTTEPKDVAAGEWNAYCTNISGCKVGYKSLAFTDGVFQAPLVAHFAGNAFDVSVALTGAVKPCADIAVDPLARESEGVVSAGQYKGDWCIPKQQQLLIKAMLNNDFCVGIKADSSVRESWHFEYKSGGTQTEICTDSQQDANIAKLKYLQNLK